MARAMLTLISNGKQLTFNAGDRMSDETDAAKPTPPSNVPTAPVVIVPVPPIEMPSPTHLARRFLACNPFYLFSAVLLLFGMYRTSVDKHFLPDEVGQLTFNLTSLQCYELLLVGTAIVLARRR